MRHWGDVQDNVSKCFPNEKHANENVSIVMQEHVLSATAANDDIISQTQLTLDIDIDSMTLILAS